ncbi:TetR/AcrR family transcriptional regulator C-terminal domain-containing protein [Nocardiopsis sp. CNT-189]|uniref:TetR/AcrR family transcriptional regulator n=1 Tax=Nocardiopsis oceanisediminis TaxID=2816862 RepID=UPI003B330F95
MVRPEGGGVLGGAEDLPVPPWEKNRSSKRSAPKRKPLTPEVITDKALEVLDRDGLDSLSMRKVAAELGVAVSALYVHVRDKEELLQVMYERVYSGFRVPEPDAEKWRSQVKEMARELRGILRSHRDMARISMGRFPSGPEMIMQLERMFALFLAAGLPVPLAAKAGDMLSLLVEGVVLEDDMWHGQGIREYTGKDAGEVGDYFSRLPADRFPTLALHGGELLSGSADERFELFLDVFISGLEAQLDRPRPAQG